MFPAIILLFLTLATAQFNPVDPSTEKDCKFFIEYPSAFTREQGNTCYSIANYWGTTREEFIRLNPFVGKECTNLTEGYSYCVEGPVRVFATSASSSIVASTAVSTPSTRETSASTAMATSSFSSLPVSSSNRFGLPTSPTSEPIPTQTFGTCIGSQSGSDGCAEASSTQASKTSSSPTATPTNDAGRIWTSTNSWIGCGLVSILMAPLMNV